MKYVVNPGVNPELMHAAIAISSEQPCRYFTSFVIGRASSYEKLVFVLPKRIALRNYLERRLVPLEDRYIIRKGIAWEVLQILFRRRFPKIQKYCIMRRNFAVHSKMRKFATRELPELVLVHYTDALDSIKFLKKLGSITYLNYPIAHHGWMRDLMVKEKKINPQLAEFLQVPDEANQTFQSLGLEIEFCDKVIVGSSFVRDTFQKQGINPRKIRVVNLGSDFKPASSLRERNYPFLEVNGPLRLVFTGQITQRKGLSYLFDALFELGDKVQCSVIGLCPDPRYLEVLETPRNVKFLGYKNKRELQEIYRNSDVFVLPSLAEGFPLAAIEAMSLGLSLVITKNTFADDVIISGSNGIVIQPQSTPEIIRAISTYLDNPELVRSMGQMAEKTAQAHTWTVYRDNLNSVLKVK